MSTRSKPPTDIYDAGTASDFGQDEPTVVDGEHITPVELPRCQECGRVVFFDDFSDAAAAIAMRLFSPDRCVRARDGHWWWCGEIWEMRLKPPR